MNRPTIEAIRLNPEALTVLTARARRARSEVMNNLVVRLINRLTPRIDVRALGLHWG